MERVYTYILLLSNATYYAGMTKDIARMLDEHRKGESKSTKGHRPVKLIWLHESPNRTAARYLEMKIKGTGARRFMKTYETGNLGQIMIQPLNDDLGNMIGWEGNQKDIRR